MVIRSVEIAFFSFSNHQPKNLPVRNVFYHIKLRVQTNWINYSPRTGHWSPSQTATSRLFLCSKWNKAWTLPATSACPAPRSSSLLPPTTFNWSLLVVVVILINYFHRAGDSLMMPMKNARVKTKCEESLKAMKIPRMKTKVTKRWRRCPIDRSYKDQEERKVFLSWRKTRTRTCVARMAAKMAVVLMVLTGTKEKTWTMSWSPSYLLTLNVRITSCLSIPSKNGLRDCFARNVSRSATSRTTTSRSSHRPLERSRKRCRKRKTWTNCERCN